MLDSWLPPGGTNKFQLIKQKRAEAEEKGITIINLSIGQPAGPALLSAREAAATAVMSVEESMHEYQDNGELGVPGFAGEFCRYHIFCPVDNNKVDYLPIPGIKPMLPLIPWACRGEDIRSLRVVTTTNPGYPTPKDWCENFGVSVSEPRLSEKNKFRLGVSNIKRGSRLLMTSYPHNPSGQTMDQESWDLICSHCARHGIRIFNDAAYAGLSHNAESCTLAEAALEHKDLSWAEAFSASKLIGNATGWRIGAMIGSPDFIEDIKTIKGNADSGFAAPMAAGVLNAIRNDKTGIAQNREMYEKRLTLLISFLQAAGMKLAVMPKAGFFTLWQTPKKAFGEDIRDGEYFNSLMIEKTGIVGVPFGEYIRYAVCTDAVQKQLNKIKEGFEKAELSY